MKLSIADLAQVPPGGSAVDAFANTFELAQLAELGYDPPASGWHRVCPMDPSRGWWGRARAAPCSPAALACPYAFAAFFQPAAAMTAFEAYRASFRLSTRRGALGAPNSMLAVNLCCARSDRAADRLRATFELFYRDGGGTSDRARRDPAGAAEQLGGIPEPITRSGGPWPPHLSGRPERGGGHAAPDGGRDGR